MHREIAREHSKNNIKKRSKHKKLTFLKIIKKSNYRPRANQLIIKQTVKQIHHKTFNRKPFTRISN